MADALHKALDRLLKSARIWIAIAGAVVAFALQISWLRGPLEDVGLERNTGLETSILLLLLVAILLEVRELARLASDSGGRQHFSDPNEMYQALFTRAGSISRPQERCLDVLGLTLFSAWPQISFWLQRPESSGWTMRFAMLSPQAQHPAGWVPEDWPSESEANARQIRKFARSNVARERSNRLEIFEYDFMPSVHGFRLGNGDLFVSNLLWQEDGKLGKPGFTYEFIPNHEAGPGAAAFRELFSNWFERAVGEIPDPPQDQKE